MNSDGANNLYRRTEEQLEGITSHLLSAAAPREDGEVDSHAFQQAIRGAVHALSTLHPGTTKQPLVTEIVEQPEQEDFPNEVEAISEETLEQDRSPSPEEHTQEGGHFLQDIPDILDADLARLILSIEEVMREGYYARPQRQFQLNEARNVPHHSVKSTFQSVILRGFRTLQQHVLPGSQITTDMGSSSGGGNGDDWLMRFLWWLSISSVVLGHFFCVFEYRRQ